ncbi:MAG: CotH kinase family protein, partial [Muribaculaceae bacterium]|nr:CotH kinase family protein [Muribaculaceae bacterium]
RVDADRVNITELDDLESDGSLISGGYIVELDNYDEDNQIRMEEKFCAGELHDMLRVTWDTPEEYSDLQKRFITEQFTAMNDFVGANSDQLWSYIDIDDAARYYLVEEIISHVEAYHGSTYLFRDRGEGQKWHYSPLWDCGNAFNGNTGKFIYDDSSYGMTWIASMRCNDKFNRKVMDTWAWFMTSCYDGVIEDIDEYAARISEAAKADRRRWANEPKPDGDDTFPVVDNSDMQGARNRAVNHLNGKIDWLRQQFGDYTAMDIVAEPARDNTAAAELPEYARPYDPSSVAELVESGFDLSGAVFYNLQGMRVPEPVHGEIYIAVSGDKARRIVY